MRTLLTPAPLAVDCQTEGRVNPGASDNVPDRTESPQMGAPWYRQEVCLRRMEQEDSLKLNERCVNVYENKGSQWKTCERSRNVYENKGSYPFKARMSLKIKVVNRRQVMDTELLLADSPPLRQCYYQAPARN